MSKAPAVKWNHPISSNMFGDSESNRNNSAFQNEAISILGSFSANLDNAAVKTTS